MSDNDYIVFGKPLLGEAEIEAVVSAMRSGWVGTGPRVHEFEGRFAKYIGCKHAVAMGSCTAALHVAMETWGLREGDEVITTPLTFAATANAVVHAGATPVFADIDPSTWNLDPARVEDCITHRTRALLPVHMYGRPADMDGLRTLANRYGLLIIEDAAHAIEAKYHGQKVGALGDASCFSFYTTKNLTTVEGGMLCTNQDAVASKARILALHGLSADAWARFSDKGYRHYDVVFSGYKYNMTDMQASIGLCQLDQVQTWLRRRETIWNRYDEAFADLPIQLPPTPEPDTVHARHLYTILVDETIAGISRDAFLLGMHEARIGTGVHYRALHTQPFYRRRFGYKRDDFPHAARVGDQTVSLPLTAGLTDAEVSRVIDRVRELLGKR